MGSGLAESFAQLKHEIVLAEQTAGRTPGSVALLAVSKTKPAALIAVSKQQQLSAFNISWHFIGPIQSNKTKIIASHFAWVHSVDRLKIAQRLSEQRPAHLPPLNICLQVNISGEASKSGIALEELAELVDQVRQLPGLRLRGVMAIPEPETDFQRQRQPYRQLFQTVQALKHPELDTFSYGMSGDLSAAICEGATIVRIGTALFGAR
jgi:pyridoxal phosphate enzyme (YggS family)